MSKNLSNDEILALARQTGLDLPAEYQAELVEAYGHVRQMIARIAVARPRADEPAHVFVPTTFLPAKE